MSLNEIHVSVLAVVIVSPVGRIVLVISQRVLIQGVSKRALQLRNLLYVYSEDMYSILNCHNVAKHTEFYL
jgi:hypothetical protein